MGCWDEPRLAGSPVPTLNKKDSHRPVAAGETLRRLTATALLATISEDLTRHLRPSQLGGPHAAVKPSSTPKTQRRGTMLLDHGLRRVHRLASYCELCCSNDSFALFGPERIPSKRVVQQDDLLGPLLFALGLHGAMSEGGAFAEAIDSPVDMAASLTTEPSARQRRLPSLWVILRRPA